MQPLHFFPFIGLGMNICHNPGQWDDAKVERVVLEIVSLHIKGRAGSFI
jgi:hypothetical protein